LLSRRVARAPLGQFATRQFRVGTAFQLQPETTGSPIAVGSKFPDVNLQHWRNPDPPTLVNMPERLAGKTVILVGLPGAFTPC